MNVIKGRPPQSIEHQRAPLDPGQRRAHLQLRLPGAAGAGRRPITLYGLAIYDVDPRALAAAGHPLRGARGLERRGYDLERGWRRAFRPAAAFREFVEARTREIERPATSRARSARRTRCASASCDATSRRWRRWAST